MKSEHEKDGETALLLTELCGGGGGDASENSEADIEEVKEELEHSRPLKRPKRYHDTKATTTPRHSSSSSSSSSNSSSLISLASPASPILRTSASSSYSASTARRRRGVFDFYDIRHTVAGFLSIRERARTTLVLNKAWRGTHDVKYWKMWGLELAQSLYMIVCEKLINENTEENSPNVIGFEDQAAKFGVGEAQYDYGCRLLYGQGLPRDPPAAASYLEQAVQQTDHPLAAHQLAVLYDTGEGVTPDALKAANLYTRAACQNVRIAQANLALVYERGVVDGFMPQTLDIAWGWFMRSMERRIHAEDEENLADAHLAFVEYLGTFEAVRRYGGQAYYCRGLALSEGLGVPVAVQVAAVAFGKAARATYPPSQQHIQQDSVQQLVAMAQRSQQHTAPRASPSRFNRRRPFRNQKKGSQSKQQGHAK